MIDLRNIIDSVMLSAIVRYDEPMAHHTSFQIGGPADFFLTPRSRNELLACLRFVHEHEVPFLLLGGGTNLLVSDRGIRGVVIHMAELRQVTVTGTKINAQAGASIEKLCDMAAQHSLSGIEFINGLPGTIGGAAWMNARCYGSSMSDVLENASVINRDLAIENVPCESAKFSYKCSPFQDMQGCIWQLDLQLRQGEQTQIYQDMEKNRADRVQKGHYRAPSAGSLFKNNHNFGAPTGRILDELGLRGAVHGGAAIAPYHGNIFINKDNASSMDVLSLVKLAMEKARRRHDIHLEPEVRFVGEWLPEELAFLHATL